MPQDLDNGDLDSIREVRQMQGHKLILLRTSDTISREIEGLVQFGSVDKTDFIRGKIAGLRTALEIPQILEDEAKQNVQKKGN